MNKENYFLEELSVISKKLHALKTLGIEDTLLKEKYNEAYAKHLEGEKDDARLLTEELTFLFSLIEDFISRQIQNIENYEKKEGASSPKEISEKDSPKKIDRQREEELKTFCDNAFDHPFFREKALQELEHFLVEEVNKHLPILKETLMKVVQEYLEEEKISIKSQLYNTLRYDLLQYLEHKRITSRK